MSYTRAVRWAGIAFAVVVFSLPFSLPAAHATLNGKYLVRNAGTDQCLRASNLSALEVVGFADCDPNDPHQRWKVVEIAANAYGYGINVLSLRDSAGNRLCLTGANYYTSQPHLMACVSGNLKQQWITSGPINYGTGFGDSYRMRWDKNGDLCLDSGGNGSSNSYLDMCVLDKNDPDRINQQWYFNLL